MDAHCAAIIPEILTRSFELFATAAKLNAIAMLLKIEFSAEGELFRTCLVFGNHSKAVKTAQQNIHAVQKETGRSLRCALLKANKKGRSRGPFFSAYF